MSQNTDTKLDVNRLIRPLTEDGIFRDSSYYNWGGSIIKANDGLYHLFYSRWKRAYTFAGWLTSSEIAHAVSHHSSGPWEYKETVLAGRGNGYWDAITAHNPKIKCFDGKYHLYYIATNFGGQAYTDNELVITNEKRLADNTWRILRENQRTGVAVSNSINGPWERGNAPLIEPTGPIATITVNPAIAKGNDGIYYLIIKGDKPNETRFIRNQAIATSESPVGPFAMQANPVIGNLDTEDVSMWYDQGDGKFYAVFHAHSFIGLMESVDGLNWEKAQNYKITDKKILLDDGSILTPDRMERPFIYIENGKPNVLCLAIKKGDDSYTIFISLFQTTK
ncbi:glycoside hydrolase family protein [bacterium]|nr:glycoside hydrolase family protein [bacterium]